MSYAPLSNACCRLSLVLLLGQGFGCSTDLFAQSETSRAQSQPPGATLPTTPVAPVSSVIAPVSSVIAPEPRTPTPSAVTPPKSACNEQAPQDFLVRAHVNSASRNRDELLTQQLLRAESIRYRTRQYGRFPGFGTYKDNPTTVKEMGALTQFFGIPITLNRRIIPALKCVEERLKTECTESPYRPQILSGLRHKNTYFDGEVSTHVFGIAIDIDPLLNSCCKCVEPWRSSPLCKGDKTVWERMSLPRCWVNVFERYGFYWLGHDVLEDTMHFEFLGDPALIEAAPASPSSSR